MTHAARLARTDALTDALRMANDVIYLREPQKQALDIIAAIRKLRDDAPPVRVEGTDRVDYLERVQMKARAAWVDEYGTDKNGLVVNHAAPEDTMSASVETPIGILAATVWRQRWTGKNGTRIAWAAYYSLNGEPITVAEIRAARLALRPTSRNRQTKEPTP